MLSRHLFQMLVFIAWTCACVAMVGHMDVGLDQSISLPQDSYLVDYFEKLSTHLSTGPPLYFVVESGHDYTTLNGQHMICSGPGCPEQSMLGQIYKASKNPKEYVLQMK